MLKNYILLLCMVACGEKHDGLDEIHQAVCQEDQPPPCCPTCCDSPIVVDVAGNGLHLTSALDGVRFELNPSHTNQWSWTETGSDDAFLAIDLNHDGQISSGEELFGNHTVQISSAAPNGFLAMAWYDMPLHGGNGDGVLDAMDDAWSQFLLWTDANHDGLSARDEMVPVSTAVSSFRLSYKPSTETDVNGNQYKYRSTLVPAPGSTTSVIVTDAWLHTAPASTPDPQGCHTNWTCGAWTYAGKGSEPYDPAHNECTLSSVVGTSLQINQINGLNYRFVFTLGFGSSTAAAQGQAEQRLDAVMYQGGNSYCTYGPIPNPDPNGSSDRETVNRVFSPPIRPQSVYSFQRACASELVCTGGCG